MVRVRKIKKTKKGGSRLIKGVKNLNNIVKNRLSNINMSHKIGGANFLSRFDNLMNPPLENKKEQNLLEMVQSSMENITNEFKKLKQHVKEMDNLIKEKDNQIKTLDKKKEKLVEENRRIKLQPALGKK